MLKLSSSAECKIRIQGLCNRISSSLNARWQTDGAIEGQAKSLKTIANPYDQRAFSPLVPTGAWLWHLPAVALAIYMFRVVNFDALEQTSDFRIERRQVVFLCWNGRRRSDVTPSFIGWANTQNDPRASLVRALYLDPNKMAAIFSADDVYHHCGFCPGAGVRRYFDPPIYWPRGQYIVRYFDPGVNIS